MDSAIRIANRYKGNQAVREFLAETMGTFILMVTFYTLLYITVAIIPLLIQQFLLTFQYMVLDNFGKGFEDEIIGN